MRDGLFTEETVMSKPLKTIVIGTSLTEGSAGVVRTGVALARTTGADVWLVHVYSPLIVPFDVDGSPLWTQQQVDALQGALADQAGQTGLSALAGYSPARVALVSGSPHREIVALARSVQADLILVGANESSHGLMGSTADRVIRNASCPVLAVRSETAFPPARVEIPVDLSPLSATALRQGLDFLAQLGVPASAAEVLFILNPFEIGGSIHFSQQQIQHFAGEELQRFLAANVPAGATPPKTQVRTGYPREEILAVLAARDADLAVLGTQGRGGFERLMVGSVAAGVLRSAACNLLIVPSGASVQIESMAARPEKPAGADWTYVSDEAPVAIGMPQG
jgi:nucleotide-binding universal stress UspA family protein